MEKPFINNCDYRTMGFIACFYYCMHIALLIEDDDLTINVPGQVLSVILIMLLFLSVKSHAFNFFASSSKLMTFFFPSFPKLFALMMQL